MIAVKFIVDGILRGVSAMRQFMIATFTDLVLRIILAFIFSAWIGSALGIWLAWSDGLFQRLCHLSFTAVNTARWLIVPSGKFCDEFTKYIY